MKLLLRTLVLLVLVSATAVLPAQCKTWTDSPQKEDAENAHVAYRNFVKGKTAQDLEQMSDAEFTDAFNNWKTAYDIAPAADGQRPFHYRDGRMFYKALRNKATDEAKKEEYTNMIFQLYDEELECYPKYEAFLLGRKASDMFYLQGYDPGEIELIERAIEVGGNETEYIVLAPLGKLLNYYFKEGQIDNARVREMYDMGTELANYNMENNERLGQYYEAAQANLEADVLEFADQIFDCAYFKEQLMPKYEENKDDLEVLKYIVTKLKAQGCEENDADVSRVQATYDALYAERKEEYEAERIRLNPGYGAQIATQEGRYDEAVDLYRQAVEKTDDVGKQSNYYYRMAAVQSGELRQYGEARRNAMKAAEIDPNNGQPYILIGDIYSRLGSSCGDSYQQRLAVLAAIDKYNQAKRVDSSVAGDANRRIGRLRGSMPIRSEAFQRGHSEGERLSVGCGINETVTLRF